MKTTKGWQLCVEFDDGATEWIPLKILKESDPIRVAEYAEAKKLIKEPAFAWWVPFTLKKRKRILKAMKKRYFRTEQKYGVELPKTVKRALEIDQETGTTYWRDALKKEMDAVMIAFKVLEEDAQQPVGYTQIRCHIVFDIKFGDLRRKARLVCGATDVDPPSHVCTYASVVSRDSVRIAFMLAALNGMDLMGADCANAYLNAESREKLCTVLGPEFGELQG